MTYTKVVYATKAEAVAALRTVRAAAATCPWRHEQRVYRCHHCPGWHLTSEPLR